MSGTDLSARPKARLINCNARDLMVRHRSRKRRQLALEIVLGNLIYLYVNIFWLILIAPHFSDLSGHDAKYSLFCILNISPKILLHDIGVTVLSHFVPLNRRSSILIRDTPRSYRGNFFLPIYLRVWSSVKFSESFVMAYRNKSHRSYTRTYTNLVRFTGHPPLTYPLPI